MKKSALILLSLLLFGCSKQPDLDAQAKTLYSFFEKHLYGNGVDYVILKSSPLTADEPVAVVFGYMEDNVVCEQLADTLRKDAPLATFKCSPLNVAKR